MQDKFKLPVVAINLEGQRVLINETDFIPNSHELWETEEQAQEDSQESEQLESQSDSIPSAPRRGRPPKAK